jgi:hypothetical protein
VKTFQANDCGRGLYLPHLEILAAPISALVSKAAGRVLCLPWPGRAGMLMITPMITPIGFEMLGTKTR